MTVPGYKSKVLRQKSYRRRLACLVIASMLLSWIPPALAIDEATPYAISTRIGSEIDSEERAYFGLFPGTEGFTLARIHKSAEGQVFIAIEREGSDGDSTIIVDARVEPLLREYIEDFESIMRGDSAARWDVLYDLAKPSAVGLDERGRRTIVVLENGREMSGELVFASTDILVLWECEKPFCWDSTRTCIRAIAPSEIEEVKVSTGTSVWKLMAGGTLGGILVGLAIVSYLDKEDEDSEDPKDYKPRHYLTVSGILGAVGFVGGTISGLIQGSEDKYDIHCDPLKYEGHLTEIKGKALLRDTSPPEFRGL
jgi:hypothetical protein